VEIVVTKVKTSIDSWVLLEVIVRPSEGRQASWGLLDEGGRTVCVTRRNKYFVGQQYLCSGFCWWLTSDDNESGL
jgi:hypothetical protein